MLKLHTFNFTYESISLREWMPKLFIIFHFGQLMRFSAFNVMQVTQMICQLMLYIEFFIFIFFDK